MPKIEGGLGLKSLLDWNNDLFGRIVWLLFNGTDSLLIAWIQANLLNERSFWLINPPTNCSWNWRRIHKLRAIFKSMLKHVVGNGRKIFLWHDNWHPLGPLFPLKYNYRLVYDSGLSINAKLSSEIRGAEWNWPLARSETMVEVMIKLCDQVYPSIAANEII